MQIKDLFTFAEKHSCSDIHLTTGYPPTFRLHGRMIQQDLPRLEDKKIREMLYSIMNEEQKQSYLMEHEIDFSAQLEGTARFRVNAFNTIFGAAAVFRMIPTEILSLEKLKAPAVFKNFTNLEKGMVLVTGPTGSGKSTTLAAIVNHINEHQKKHIITIEDPVEFVHSPKSSVINQREVGGSTLSFARALKSSLREDPDVILVGELRDLETISLALTAAETGHLVFGTLHTSSAPQTVNRIIDVFPSSDKAMIRAMLSNSLEGVISQKLLPLKDGNGRVAVHEVMLANNAIRNLIREDKIPQMYSMIQIGKKAGMQVMNDCVLDVLHRGIVSEDTAMHALNIVEDRKGFKKQGEEQISNNANSVSENVHVQKDIGTDDF